MGGGFHVWQQTFLFQESQRPSNIFSKMDLTQILATRSRAVFSYRINFKNIGYANIDKMKEWCETNCEGIWRQETHYALYWQFEQERDAMLFMLRWGSAEGNSVK